LWGGWRRFDCGFYELAPIHGICGGGHLVERKKIGCKPCADTDSAAQIPEAYSLNADVGGSTYACNDASGDFG
jgi:hypothetical protein